MQVDKSKQLKIVATGNMGRHWALVNRETGEKVAEMQCEKIEIIADKGVTKARVTFIDIPIEVNTQPYRESRRPGQEPVPEIIAD